MCVKSKAVLLILLCTFFIYSGNYFSLFLSSYLLTENIALLQNTGTSSALALCEDVFFALLFLFFPLGGWIGDVRCGRYKTVKGGLVFLIIMLVIPIAVSCVNLVLFKYPTLFTYSGAKAVTVIVLVCLIIIGISGYISFLSNIIPLAMDQLRDAPALESSLFIYWYIWTINLCSLMAELISPRITEQNMFLNSSQTLSTVVAVFMTLASVLVLISLIVFRVFLQVKERWFNTEPCQFNPYKLVYKVTRFSFQHKLPIRRSAFTYCEDELPSGLNLGKSKYGGPFTTEEVEDVKVFYEILKVLVSIGPLFYLDLYGDYSGLKFQLQAYNSSSNFVTIKDLYNGMQTIITLIIIPIYLMLCHRSRLCTLSTFRSLTRIEVGTLVLLLSMVFKLGVNIAAHAKNEDLSCTFQLNGNDPLAFSPLQIVPIIFVEEVLVSFSEILLFVSFFEFICAQSPHSMKGMLIGLGYAIQGIFGLLGLILQIPFSYWKYSYPSCGFVYNSMNIVIGIVSFIVLTMVVKRYKYRERDEPSRERQFAEEYYSNIQQEPNYDYSI